MSPSSDLEPRIARLAPTFAAAPGVGERPALSGALLRQQGHADRQPDQGAAPPPSASPDSGGDARRDGPGQIDGRALPGYDSGAVGDPVFLRALRDDNRANHPGT